MNEQLPDLLLIERARGGEPEAVGTLIRRYGRRLYRVAASLTGDEHAALAVLEDTFRSAFADLSRYEPTGKFAAWLTRIAYQLARAQRRVPGSAPVTAEPLAERAELEHRLGRLPEAFRTVFVLRVVEGISGIETAACLGVHETTVRTRLYRAHRRLGEALVQRVRAAQGLYELAEGQLAQIAQRVPAQLGAPVTPTP
ncbi:MAG: sigma-70 family RNA polymerase sigma factor [Proteobacteria bacterium]|nr:sigma-70 family RNA polymerase sigma factor [Pseudomonadota bacterium]